MICSPRLGLNIIFILRRCLAGDTPGYNAFSNNCIILGGESPKLPNNGVNWLDFIVGLSGASYISAAYNNIIEAGGEVLAPYW